MLTKTPAAKNGEESALGEFASGMYASLPAVIATMPFGILVGALSIENGMSVFEAVFMSGVLVSGASQVASIELLGQKVSPALIVFSVFAISIRHILYSAALGRLIGHWSFAQKAFGFYLLVDPAYAEAERRAQAGRTVSFSFFMGIVIPTYVLWILETLVGALFGKLIANPYAFGMDFVVPIYFLGMVMMFRKRPSWLRVVLVSAVVSIAVYQTIGPPLHLSLGGLAGMLCAAFFPALKREEVTN